ncbi:unnamed protein product, partial [Candidula unifasciata]
IITPKTVNAILSNAVTLYQVKMLNRKPLKRGCRKVPRMGRGAGGGGGGGTQHILCRMSSRHPYNTYSNTHITHTSPKVIYRCIFCLKLFAYFPAGKNR